MNSINAHTETFMSSLIQDGEWESTPANMLRDPGDGIGLTDLAEEWVAEIIASDDPDFELSKLIDHLTGVLHGVKVVRKHYTQFIGKAA